MAGPFALGGDPGETAPFAWRFQQLRQANPSTVLWGNGGAVTLH